MFGNLNVFKMSHAMAVHAGRAQATAAQNVANADTPGYVARELPSFASAYRPDPTAQQRATRQRHLNGHADGPTIPPRHLRQEASPNGNNVSLETEMMQAATALREHDRALAIYKSGLAILRNAVGR